MEGREDYEQARVASAIEARKAHIIRGGDAKATAAPVSEVLSMLMVAGVFAYADWRIGITHLGPFPVPHLTLGGLAAFVLALMTAGQFLRQFATTQTVMAEGMEAARRVFATVDVTPEIRDAGDARQLQLGQATVRLDDVSFSYDGEAPVLAGVSLEAKRGEIVALVGPSGAGKTTVLNLIPRFYDVTAGAGALTIDDQDVRSVTLASLRAQIALVTQEPFLFDDTIAANIAYAKADASQAEIEAAARAAAAHDFVLALPKGYETQVGEAGARLSGGQRQRIAIARAFLKDAPILLLDEATSALDSESEAQVQAALERLIAGRTTILIAHRLSTVRGADRIYVIDAGKVVEIGAHAELIGAGGLYARLARTQDLEAESAA